MTSLQIKSVLGIAVGAIGGYYIAQLIDKIEESDRMSRLALGMSAWAHSQMHEHEDNLNVPQDANEIMKKFITKEKDNNEQPTS